MDADDPCRVWGCPHVSGDLVGRARQYAQSRAYNGLKGAEEGLVLNFPGGSGAKSLVLSDVALDGLGLYPDLSPSRGGTTALMEADAVLDGLGLPPGLWRFDGWHRAMCPGQEPTKMVGRGEKRRPGTYLSQCGWGKGSNVGRCSAG